MRVAKGIITVGSFAVAIVVGVLVTAAAVIAVMSIAVGDILGCRKRKAKKIAAEGNGKLQALHTARPFK